MSAYIVSTDTMNRVVNAIMARYWAPGGSRSYTHFCGIGLFRETAEQQIAAALYALNRDAVMARYPHNHSEGDYSDIPACHYTMLPVKKVDAYKAISCLLYQCCEGTCDETTLYRELEAFQVHLAHEIIADLPEYEAAPWG